MEKNKSIDGLRPRSSQKTAKPKVVKKKIPVQKTSPKRTVAPKAPAKPAKKIRVATTEDFLKPVQAFDFDEESGILKKSTKKNVGKPKKEKKKMSKKRKISLGVIVAILAFLVFAAIGFILWGNDIIAKITGGQGNVFDLLFHDETYVDLKTDANGRTNILAFGTSGYNMEGEVGNGVHDGAALTDSIMAISLNQKTGDIAMISLPRDLKASPTCTATGKINEVFWCNNPNGDKEQAGADALMTSVGTILGIEFQYYAHVNWSSVVEIVNVLGGITVTIDENVPDYYGTGYSYSAGNTYDIDGTQALILSRARYGTTGGDFTRSANQQKILIGIKDRVLEKNLSIPDYLSLASTLGDNLRTSFTIDELKSLAHLTFDFNFDSMRQVSLLEPERLLTTGTINGISYVLPTAGVGNYGRIQNYVSTMLDNDPRVYEQPSILILNGTNEDGLAATEKSNLEENGYSNITIDNLSDWNNNDRYTIFALTEKPGTKGMLGEYYHTAIKLESELPENVPKNSDFIIILGGKSDAKDKN